jgi:hypothetical protein
MMSTRNKSVLLVLLLSIAVPLTAEAGELSNRNELSLGFGGAFGQASPDSGGLIDVHYARAVSDSLWLVVRPEFVLNLNAPEGMVAKQAAFGLDLGIRWHFGPPDTVHVALGAALGARGYFEPGYGGCLRLDANLYVPVTNFMDVIISGAVEAGVASLGDETSRTELQRRGDLWMGLAFRF